MRGTHDDRTVSSSLRALGSERLKLKKSPDARDLLGHILDHYTFLGTAHLLLP